NLGGGTSGLMLASRVWRCSGQSSMIRDVSPNSQEQNGLRRAPVSVEIGEETHFFQSGKSSGTEIAMGPHQAASESSAHTPRPGEGLERNNTISCWKSSSTSCIIRRLVSWVRG